MFRYLQVAVLVVISSILVVDSKESELRFVTVIFRHGDRAPTDYEMYPNDPYINHTFYPMGLGGLTNSGKQREYQLGQKLRKRYNDFLGGVYIPNDVLARSTDSDRTKMSLLLVLAGLYPPVPEQNWDSTLSWQPIPITYEPNDRDILLGFTSFLRYLDEFERVKKLPEVAEKIEKFRPLMRYLTTHTGKVMNNTRDMWFLYHSLTAEYSMGLELPKWTNDIFPNGTLYDVALFEYEIASYNDLLKKLYGGPALKRISDDMVATISGKSAKARKMNLFGCHEKNVVNILQNLGVYTPHVPEYASAAIVELHTIDNAHYVKVVRYLGIPPVFTVETIPGCDVLCPLDNFLKLMKNVTPTDEDLDGPRNVT